LTSGDAGLTGDARLLEFLRDLVRTESTAGREERVVRRIAEEMWALGYDSAEVDAAGNAVGRIGSGSPAVLVDCHVDTIPLHGADSWRHPPLAAEVAGGRLYGLGACDMKASAAAAVYGIARLVPRRERLAGTVWVVCSIAEEMMEGAALAATFDRCGPDLAIVGEPSDLRLCVGQRGRAKLEVDVTGVPCHAAHPEVGVNAVEGMAEYIAAVARLEHPTDRELGVRSITCIDIHSEPCPSVSTVPGWCRAHFDCRFGHGETEASLLELMQGAAAVWDRLESRPALDCRVCLAEFETYRGQAFTVPELAPAWYTPPDSPLVRGSLAALARAGIPPRTATYGFCTNGSLTAGLRGVPTVGFGIGREEEAHVVDEHVDLESLFRGTLGYTAIVGELLGAPLDDG
jgi:putative selenium metabolism hydrolase